MAKADDKKDRSVSAKKAEMGQKMVKGNTDAKFSSKDGSMIARDRKIVNGKMPKSDWLT